MEKRHHTPRNQISAPLFCKKCGKVTQHKCQDRRITHCIPCEERLQPNYKPPAEYVPGKTMLIPIPCKCPKYPVAHYHEDGKLRDTGPRFAREGEVGPIVNSKQEKKA